MKKNELIFGLSPFIVFLLFPFLSHAQGDLYTPVELEKAYQAGTRSPDGKPGENYWQNGADYSIKAKLDPKSRQINGEQAIIYYNNSPDSLSQMIIRLYQDLYKIGNMRDFPLDSADLHAGTKIFQLKIRGREVELDDTNEKIRRRGTNLMVPLEIPLPPGEKLEIDLSWQVQLPAVSRVRMGAFGDSAFFVAYWYPRIAVYDDIDGWDMFSYTGSQEFYNDFVNFDVSITVPGDYLVWATGLLQNGNEVLQETYWERYRQAMNTDQIIHIIKAEDYQQTSITRENPTNTWHFIAQNVPDFAFASSNCYLWDATSCLVDSLSGRRVFVDAAYRVDSDDFYEVAEIAKETIEFLSFEMPGFPFPYPKLTVFNGSGGMEFPMMVNDGSTMSRARTVGLTSHEITHSYFPFFMGTNEKKYAWMDEGWAVMLPFDFQDRNREDGDQLGTEVSRYNSTAGSELDLPMMIPSVMMRGRTYRNAAYRRPAIAYALLRDLLGDEAFKKAMHLYINRWNGKHPIPHDFFYTFDQVYGSSLGWFWRPWFFQRGFPDVGIKSVTTENGWTCVAIEKIGLFPVAVQLTVTFSDESVQHFKQSAEVWRGARKETTIWFEHSSKIKKIELGNAHIPDINNENNVFISD